MTDYKKVADYHNSSGQNVQDFWDLTQDQRKHAGLPNKFAQEFYVAMHEWFAARASINPIHHRDVFSPSDGNFLPHIPLSQRQTAEGDDSDSDDPIQIAERAEAAKKAAETNVNQQNPSAYQNIGRRNCGPQNRPTNYAPAAFTGLPPGVTPYIISSSENTTGAAPVRPGNTGVKRKNQSGPAVIAEATRSTGAIMASQLKDISDASLQVERSKVDVQVKLFQEQMTFQREQSTYHRERDMRIHEALLMAHENARLAVLKQHEMVQSLQQLTAVLGAGLAPRPSTYHGNGLPQVPPATAFRSPTTPGNSSAHGNGHNNTLSPLHQVHDIPTQEFADVVDRNGNF